VETFNRHNANIRALTDPNITLKDAKDHFKKYYEKFLRKDELSAFNTINTEYSQLRSSQEGLLRDNVKMNALVNFICKSLLPARFILDEVNTLLKSSSNPRKLAYLRYVISDLFTATRDSYRDSKLKEGTFQAVVNLNEKERSRIHDYINKYVMFTHFLDAVALEPSKEVQLIDGQVLLEITVPNKAAGTARCNGYLQWGQRALFNLGNYLKVTGVSVDGRLVRAALL
jgi:hypothetical protein